MSVPESQTVAVTIESATPSKRGDEDRWELKIKVPFSQRAITTFIPREWATLDDVVKGSTHMLTVARGRKIKDDSDGEKAWQYYWDVTAWDTAAAPTPAAENGGNGGGSQDEFRRSKAEMRWTEALNMATALAAGLGKPGTNLKPAILEDAEWFYQQLEAGPGAAHMNEPPPATEATAPAVDDDPIFPPEPPADLPDPAGDAAVAAAVWCRKHNVPFDHHSANSGRKYHDMGSYSCVAGIGLVDPKTGEAVGAPPGGKKQ